ncbi:hypothetical protein [Salinibius halmophilus]|uniref:hypothetical protein n=1 Tax=Salinibius halmophilus TaxID=1853216 RepID=UPI000E667556|nr:hypothetical protein [Salinibius halmophilus]
MAAAGVTMAAAGVTVVAAGVTVVAAGVTVVGMGVAVVRGLYGEAGHHVSWPTNVSQTFGL